VTKTRLIRAMAPADSAARENCNAASALFPQVENFQEAKQPD